MGNLQSGFFFFAGAEKEKERGVGGEKGTIDRWSGWEGLKDFFD